MIKYCLQKWDTNKEKLREFLRTQKGLNDCNYLDLVIAVVENVLNPSDNDYDYKWDYKHITEIDNGDYQGTLLFLIPLDTYQPCEHEYLITYVGYGSCSGCDALMSIQECWNGDGCLTEIQIKDYMSLCKDILTNIKKPYNCGWRNEEIFDEVVVTGVEK